MPGGCHWLFSPFTPVAKAKPHYWGAAAVGTKLYFTPYNDDAVGVLDTETGIFEGSAVDFLPGILEPTTIFGIQTGLRRGAKYRGAVAVRGAVYFPPYGEVDVGVLNTTTWQLGQGGFEVWSEVNERFPVEQVDTVSGPEDPRALRLADETYLFVAAWESTKVQWQHMARGVPVNKRTAQRDDGDGDRNQFNMSDGGGRGAWGGNDDSNDGGSDEGGKGRNGFVSRRLEVDSRFSDHLQLWLPQFQQLREQRSREKNWSPFEWRGAIYLEYSLEPRLVLLLNVETSVATPLLPLSTSRSMCACRWNRCTFAREVCHIFLRSFCLLIQSRARMFGS